MNSIRVHPRRLVSHRTTSPISTLPIRTVATARASFPTTKFNFQRRCHPSKFTSHQQRRTYAAADSLKRTPLYDLHVANSGKMVPFASYSMPVQYGSHSISDSHLFTRSHASLFDVSHMVQHRLRGPGAQTLLERITPAGLGALPNHHSTLSCFLLPETGGIVDDSIITRLGPEEFYFVTNAACREVDLKFLKESIDDFKKDGGESVEREVLDGHGLVALQGPLAHEILRPLLVDSDPALENLLFGQCRQVQVELKDKSQTSPLLLSRGGYTGEDGFEISVPPDEVTPFVDTLLSYAGPEKLRLAGLGARDTLRLEAGMCLYGHDIDSSTTPVEAGLSWVIAKERREGGKFNGDNVILKQLVPKSKGGAGVERRRIGLMLKEGSPPAREGAVVEAGGTEVGKVTSGAPSPSLGRNIAMAYLKDGFHKKGTSVDVVVRGKKHAAEVVKMPFVPSKYWKGGASPG